jgi:hypothetical protein
MAPDALTNWVGRKKAETTPRSLDQAPAADPALDALDALDALHDLDDIARRATGLMKGTTQAATIRDALADRITADEARLIVMWAETCEANGAVHDSAGGKLLVRLGRIADRDEEAGK